MEEWELEERGDRRCCEDQIRSWSWNRVRDKGQTAQQEQLIYTDRIVVDVDYFPSHSLLLVCKDEQNRMTIVEQYWAPLE